ECLEDWIDQNNPVRAIDAFVDKLDLPGVGFDGVAPDHDNVGEHDVHLPGEQVGERQCLAAIWDHHQVSVNRSGTYLQFRVVQTACAASLSPSWSQQYWQSASPLRSILLRRPCSRNSRPKRCVCNLRKMKALKDLWGFGN